MTGCHPARTDPSPRGKVAVMISAQHRAMKSAPGAPMLPLYMDAALAQFRRLLEAELAKEGDPGSRR